MGHSSDRRICAAASTSAPSEPTRSRILVHSRLRTPSGQRILEGVPNERDEISRPRAPTCVFDIHDRDHCSVADLDIAGGCEIGMDHVRCDSWWWDVGTREPQALNQGRHRGGIPRKAGYGLSEKHTATPADRNTMSGRVRSPRARTISFFLKRRPARWRADRTRRSGPVSNGRLARMITVAVAVLGFG